MPSRNFAESGVSSVQMGSILVHDEELGAGGIRVHGSCHGKHALRMLKVIGDAVLAEFSLDGIAWASHAVSVGAAALDHKAIDDSVENQTVVKTFLYQADKIIYCVWCDFWIKLCFHHIAVFHCNCYNRIFHILFRFLSCLDFTFETDMSESLDVFQIGCSIP